MANNVATKGFAYHLGHGLGTAVACLRAGERRVLVSAGRVGAPVRLMARLLFLAMKLGAVVALIVALLPALSWLASFVLGFVFLAGMVYLVAKADLDASDFARRRDTHDHGFDDGAGYRTDEGFLNGPDGAGYYEKGVRIQ